MTRPAILACLVLREIRKPPKMKRPMRCNARPSRRVFLPSGDMAVLQILFFVLLMASSVLPRTTAAQASLYADPRAAHAGDLLTVLLVERTTAQRESAWNNQSNAAFGGSAETAGGDLSGRFALDAQVNRRARNLNSSSQRDLLTGTITARVLEVDPQGNLVIEGERRLSVNGETHLLRISGLVRRIDVRSNNTVLSPDIAGASIEYQRGGIHRRFFRPAMLARTALVGVILAAVLVGSN